MQVVGGRRPMADLLKEVSGAVGGVCLVSFAEDRVQWLVPMMSWLQIGGVAGDNHLHTLDRVRSERCECPELGGVATYRRDDLQDAVVGHDFNRHAYCGQIELSFQKLGADLTD